MNGRFSICSSLLALAAACQVQRPAAGAGFESPHFVHSTTTAATCVSCHEKDRPAAFQGATHGGGKDCGLCHGPRDSVGAGWLPNLAFSHVPAPSGCLDCHAKARPAPPHPATGDCVGCHPAPAFKAPQ